MKINNTNSINFNGIYKLPYTAENIKEIEECIFPVYDSIRKEKFTAFIGTNPFKSNLFALIKHIAQSNNISIEELKTCAKRDGLNINDLGDNAIYIITGNKDNKKFNDFLVKRMAEQGEDTKKVQCCFSFFKQKLNLPGYLNNILGNIILDEQENMAFRKFADKVVEVKKPYELLEKSFREK